MFLGIKIIVGIVGIGVGVWAGFKLCGLIIDWLKEGFNSLKPERFRKEDKFY